MTTISRKEQLTVAKAANYIFKSGLNTFKFYDLRNKLALGHGSRPEILSRMKEIVLEEIDISRALIPITEEDNRIGYHSEAHGYKIFPEKLRWRIGEMENLLKTEFVEVEERIKEGLLPLPFYYGKEEGARAYEITESDISRAKWLPFIDENGNETDKTRIRAAHKDGTYTVSIYLEGEGDTVRIDPEFKILHRVSPIILSEGGFTIPESASYSFFGERAERIRKAFTLDHKKSDGIEIYTLTFEMQPLRMTEGDPFRLMIKRSGSRTDVLAPADRVFTRLIVGHFSPDAFAFFIPKT